jgi:hypothetical protein
MIGFENNSKYFPKANKCCVNAPYYDRHARKKGILVHKYFLSRARQAGIRLGIHSHWPAM